MRARYPRWAGPLSVAAAVLLLGSPVRTPAQQSTLPATERTSTAPQKTSISPSQLPSANPAVAPSHSDVVWSGTTLEIRASNASLNSLLQQIAVRTGIKLTGSAPEERIFGSYGPGTLDEVLLKLLDGLPVNIMLVGRSGSEPKELLLTPREGKPSPPSPASRDEGSVNGAGFQAQQGGNPQQQGGNVQQPNANGFQQNPASAAATPTDGTQPGSPNGVKTPQEIYEQLQRLRTQQNR